MDTLPQRASRAVAAGTTLAITQSRYGSPDALSLTRGPTPRLDPDQVLVRVHAASVNARDWHIMRGEPTLARLLDRKSFSLRGPRDATRGTDVAGVVQAVGSDVTAWRPGDAVFGEGTGTFAEHAVASTDQLATLPTGMTFEHAAALPLAGTTALLCVTAPNPAPGSHVLINGASGGVGTLAVQLAKSMEVHVTAVVSPRNLRLAKTLGADRVIDYTSSDFTDQGRQYDVVIDLVGNHRLRALRRVVRAGGALVLSGGGTSGSGRTVGPMRLLMGAAVAARFLPFRVLTPEARPTTAGLGRIAELVAAGDLRPVIDRTVPLMGTPAAIRYLETEHARAKVVITVR